MHTKLRPTRDNFKVLTGKLCQDDIGRLKERYTKSARLGKHVQAHPRDDDNKADLIFVKESLANTLDHIQIDANVLGLDLTSLQA
jgi:hypothetical protein